MDVLARLDLVFCVDLTGSMTPFIAAARTQMARVLEALRASPDVDLRTAIVGYRDHGSLELVEVYAFDAVSAKVQACLDGLTVRSPPENTDAAEAVFSGLAACLTLPWREGTYRVVVLVGDAPPHGCGANMAPYPDRYRDVDPTGLSLDDMANRLEEAGVFVHALALVPSISPQYDGVLEQAFRRIGIGTGGSFHSARSGDAAMAVVNDISRRCLRNLEFDRRLHAELRSGPATDAPALAQRMHVSEEQVYGGLMRLRQRGLHEVGDGPPR